MISPVSEFMERIESPEFLENLVMSRNVKGFRLILKQSELVRRLVHEAQESEDNLKAVIERLLELLKDRGPSYAQHRHDCKIGAYLYVLFQAEHRCLSLVLGEIEWTEGLYWTHQLMHRLE